MRIFYINGETIDLDEEDVVVGQNSLNTFHEQCRILVPFSQVMQIRFVEDPFKVSEVSLSGTYFPSGESSGHNKTEK